MGWFGRGNDEPKGYVEEDTDLAEINEIHDRAKAFGAVDDDMGRQVSNKERNKLTEEVELRREKRVVYDYEESRFYFDDPCTATDAELLRRKPWNGKW